MKCALILSLSACLLLTATAQKKPKPLPPGVTVDRDLVYATRDGVPLHLDLYRAADAKGPLPVVVWVHGGGWKAGSRINPKGLWLCKHGYAIASIDYRLIPEHQWPKQIDDCYEAVRWLRSSAKEHGLDPAHIGAWGSSAGGHLVALMGTRPYAGEERVSSQVQAVCDWFGPSELLTMPPNTLGANGRTLEDIASSNGAKLLGATVRDVPAKARDASAIDHVSADDVPFLILHGDADPAVPVEQSLKLHARLKAAGVDSQLHLLKGAKHGGPEFLSEEANQWILTFFDAHLK